MDEIQWPADGYQPGILGYNLFCRYYKPLHCEKRRPRAVVFVVHGYAEYCGTDPDLIDALVQAGFFVVGHDHVGHGQSEGPKGVIADFHTYVQDVIIHSDRIRAWSSNVPFFILGHSMGGAVALLTVLDNPQSWQGMVLLSPLVQCSEDLASPTKRFLAWMLAKVMPGLGLMTLNQDHLSKDESVVHRFKTDPLIFRGKISIGSAYACLTACDKIVQNLDRINWPFLCIQAGDDRLCDRKGAELLLEKSTSSDKTVQIYPEAYHRVQNEPEGVGARCIRTIVQWISDRISSSETVISHDVKG